MPLILQQQWEAASCSPVSCRQHGRGTGLLQQQQVASIPGEALLRAAAWGFPFRKLSYSSPDVKVTHQGGGREQERSLLKSTLLWGTVSLVLPSLKLTEHQKTVFKGDTSVFYLPDPAALQSCILLTQGQEALPGLNCVPKGLWSCWSDKSTGGKALCSSMQRCSTTGNATANSEPELSKLKVGSLLSSWSPSWQFKEMGFSQFIARRKRAMDLICNTADTTQADNRKKRGETEGFVGLGFFSFLKKASWQKFKFHGNDCIAHIPNLAATTTWDKAKSPSAVSQLQFGIQNNTKHTSSFGVCNGEAEAAAPSQELGSTLHSSFPSVQMTPLVYVVINWFPVFTYQIAGLFLLTLMPLFSGLKWMLLSYCSCLYSLSPSHHDLSQTTCQPIACELQTPKP